MEKHSFVSSTQQVYHGKTQKRVKMTFAKGAALDDPSRLRCKISKAIRGASTSAEARRSTRKLMRHSFARP